jgi:hypothetical protein
VPEGGGIAVVVRVTGDCELEEGYVARKRSRHRTFEAFATEVAGVGVLFLAVWQHPVGRVAVIALGVVAVVTGVMWSRRRLFPRWRDVWNIDELRALTPDQFERVTADMLTAAGWTDVAVSGGAGDLQADVTGVSPLGRRTVVQCKRYGEGNNIGSPEIQSFIGMVNVHHRAHLGMFVTTSSFTKPAVDLAFQHGIVMVDGEGVINGLGDEQERYRL